MSKQQLYPHANKYITAKGIAEASKETLETWEYEASICSTVEIAVVGKDAVGRLQCPKCGGDLFRLGDILVNYSVPFVSINRINMPNFFADIFHYKRLKSDSKVQCLTCQTMF
jgi:hypothetical protein